MNSFTARLESLRALKLSNLALSFRILKLSNIESFKSGESISISSLAVEMVAASPTTDNLYYIGSIYKYINKIFITVSGP